MTRRIGDRTRMRGLASSHTVALLAVATLSMVATAQPTRVVARRMSDTVVKGDTLRFPTTRPPLMILLRKIDSLAQLQDSMRIGSPEYVRVDEQLGTLIQSLVPVESDGRVTIRLGAGAAEQMSRTPFAAARMKMDVEPRGWLGMFADGVHQDWLEADGHYYQYFVYPIVVTVDANSPAAKVGVQHGDSLIAFNGMDLRRNIVNLTRLIDPGHTLRVTLRRDGETKDVSLLPEKIPPDVAREREVAAVRKMLFQSRAPMMSGDSTDRWFVERAAAGGRGLAPVRAATKAPMARMAVKGIFDASMTDLEPAAVFALTQQKESHGVLVTEVPPGSLAARIGLRGGDIIITVDDADVTSLLQLHHEVMTRSANRSTQFVVVRSGKIEKLNYEPR